MATHADDKPETQQHEEELGGGERPADAIYSEEIDDSEARPAESRGSYKVYKRRFFGLAQLVLLNIVVSWDWLTFSAVSSTASDYFNVSEGAINWLSTSFLFSFCVASPVVMWTLNHGGPKPSIVASASLLLVGNWIRFAGAKAQGGMFGVVMFGQILIGFSQPFVLTAPTRYSDLWFTDRGRTSATAIATLANPLGGALGQLIGPAMATETAKVPDMVLYVAIISSVASIPSFFIPSRPATPPSPASSVERTPFTRSPFILFRTPEFWLIFLPFSVYVGLFNSISSLLNQILEPHGFSETDAGITGGILIVVGLIAAAICSPITDRYKHHLGTIKILIPVIAATYIGFVFAPSKSSNVAGPFVNAAIMGASSFAILPVALEYLVEITYPMSPEIPSTICWVGGQILGAVSIIIENELKAGPDAHPPHNMWNALIYQAVVACVVVPLPLCLGLFGRDVRKRRFEAETQEGAPASPEASPAEKHDALNIFTKWRK